MPLLIWSETMVEHPIFGDPFALFRRKDESHVKRSSGTLAESVKHGTISTVNSAQMDPTIHHTVIAGCPHPRKEFALKGEFYMLAYVSIPVDWLPFIDEGMSAKYRITFVGPAGTIQKLPPALKSIEDIVGERVYVGFDYLNEMQPISQPNPEQLRIFLSDFVADLYQRARAQLTLDL